MTIAILESAKGLYGEYFTLECGTKSAYVGFNTMGYVTVCCNNAAHKCWRGAGKSFRCLEDALRAYKSGEMRAMIAAAYAAYGDGKLDGETAERLLKLNGLNGGLS